MFFEQLYYTFFLTHCVRQNNLFELGCQKNLCTMLESAAALILFGFTSQLAIATFKSGLQPILLHYKCCA